MIDEFVTNELKFNEMAHHHYDDAYVVRAFFWAKATAFENQLTYLGGNFLVNQEGQLNRMSSTGFFGETDIAKFKFANEDQLHVQDDVPKEDRISEQKARIDQTKARMDWIAIVMVLAIREHDKVSQDLNLMTYGEIKRRAAEKKSSYSAPRTGTNGPNDPIGF